MEEAPEGTYDAIIVDSSDPIGNLYIIFEQTRFFILSCGVHPHLSFKPVAFYVPLACLNLVSDAY